MIQTIHILSIAVMMSAVLMINLRLMGRMRDEPLVRVFDRFKPIVMIAFGALLSTGIVLIIGEPTRSLPNKIFQLKMILLVAALATLVGCQLPLREKPSFWDSSNRRRRAAHMLSILCLLLWSGIVIAGRWIAYY